jgi:GNAT superfamily N-acetyltransferase
MRRVRDSAFEQKRLPWRDRLSRRRRYLAECGRYPYLLTRNDCWVVRAEAMDGLVGYAWAYTVTECPCWAYIDDVAVHVDHQGHGIGSGLIDELVAWLRDSDVRHITGLAIDGRMARIFHRHGITAVPPSARCEHEDQDVDW